MKNANAWGLHEMSGNVYEWCLDRYDEKLAGGLDPAGASSGSFRVLRGGDWDDNADYHRVEHRFAFPPTHSGDFIGFRVVRSAAP